MEHWAKQCEAGTARLPVPGRHNLGTCHQAPHGATHICVCICTYRRPLLLGRLLQLLQEQETEGLFTYSIVVSDNDRQRSAEAVVANCAVSSRVPIKYCVEPRQSIALARNKAVANATGHYVAFIDDDEFPTRRWLVTLLTVCTEFGADGVLGPVKPHFDATTPGWVIKGRFYDRPVHPTGLTVEWQKARTGNVLLKKELLAEETEPFRPQFRNGEDQDFFRRMIEKRHVFIWCADAEVHEDVPPARWKHGVMLRRALLRGASAALQPSVGALSVAKSILAVAIYVAALLPACLLGHHRFMSLLVKSCDHAGKLLALLGINPIREPYITD